MMCVIRVINRVLVGCQFSLEISPLFFVFFLGLTILMGLCIIAVNFISNPISVWLQTKMFQPVWDFSEYISKFCFRKKIKKYIYSRV